MNIKKIVLPRRPVPVVLQKPVPVKDPSDLSTVKAIRYEITLDDGSSLRAEGEHANLIFQYLSECEKTCAQHGTVTYLGPSLARYDADNKFMAQSTGIDPAKVRS
jgi:hypothetical protein